MPSNQDPAQIWNERYSKPVYAYGKEPNAFFKAELAKLTPGGILLPAEGEGRNAVHALQQGWSVIAFDQSEKAKEKALALAEDKAVDLQYTVANALTYDCPVLVDALCYCYFHVPQNVQQAIYDRINGFLTKGGALIFEAFSVHNLTMNSGGPKTESMLFTVQGVRDLFKGFTDIDVWEEKVVLDEGLYHSGEAWVIRARGRK